MYWKDFENGWNLLLVYFSLCSLCHAQNLLPGTQMADTGIKKYHVSNLESLIAAAISSNDPVFDALATRGGAVELPAAVPLSVLSRSTWQLPSINHQTDINNVLNSVPVKTHISSKPADSVNSTDFQNDTVLYKAAAKKYVENLAGSEKNISAKRHEQLNASNAGNTIKHTAAGLYIPMDKVSRVKRQLQNNAASENGRGRVVVLVNSRKEQKKVPDLNQMDGSVLVLVKKSNKTSAGEVVSDPVITVKTRNSLHELLASEPAVSIDTREVTQGLPAIQRISDLNSVDLALTAGNQSPPALGINSTLASKLKLLTNEQIESILKIINAQEHGNSGHGADSTLSSGHSTPSFSSTRRVENSSQRPSVNGIRQHTLRPQITRLDERNFQSLPNSVQGRPEILRVSSPRARHTPGSGRQASHARGVQPNRPGVIPRLAVETPTSSRRITPAPQTNSSNRPLVQTMSRQSLNRQTQGRRVIQPQIRRSSNSQRHQSPQPNRSQPRQVTRRRRPSPPDPFTQRFSAGFQRGSNLLNQPPLELRSFDGTGGNVGFNTLQPGTNRVALTRPPGLFNMLGPPPPMFGGPLPAMI